MSGCRITDEWEINGIKTVIIENQFIKVTFLVDYGCKICEIIFKPADKDFLWHNPRLELIKPVYGSNVDNWLTGGLDEVLPTGHPCRYKNEDLPMLGELWSLPWNYSIIKNTDKEIEVYFSRKTIIYPFIVEKWVSLEKDETIINFKHKITNLSNRTLPFLWGLHPCFSINQNTRIDIPALEVLIEESYPDDWLGKKSEKYLWPYLNDRNGNRIDMRIVRSPDSNTCEFQFATKLKSGWISVNDEEARLGIGMVFPENIFSVLWLWLSYGGWRNHYLAAIEPWTGYPPKLTDAIEKGRFMEIKPNEIIECSTKIVVFKGKSKVVGIKKDGTVL